MTEIKPLYDHLNKGNGGDIVRDIIKLDWVFSKWYEKILLIACILWSSWSLTSWLWRLIV